MNVNWRNLNQAVLYDSELSGQISDGFWENTRPYDHWKKPCNLKSVVDPDNVGISTWLIKNNYNFANKKLLNVVGYRMLIYVRFSKWLKNNTKKSDGEIIKYISSIESILESICEGGIPSKYMFKDKSYKKYIKGLKLIFRSFDKLQIILKDESIYSMKEMKEDLNDMRKIFKTRID